MRRRIERTLVAVGLLLGCAPGPTEVVPDSVGTTDPTTVGSSTSTATTPSTSSPADSAASGSGSATGLDADTTVGVQPGTSTGEPAGTSTGEPAGTSTGEPAGTSTGETSTGAVPSCDDLFGDAPDYVFCMETEVACYFNATTSGGNCNDMCSMLGSVCLEAFDNPNAAGQECDVIPSMDTCDTNRSTEICACAK